MASSEKITHINDKTFMDDSGKFDQNKFDQFVKQGKRADITSIKLSPAGLGGGLQALTNLRELMVFVGYPDNSRPYYDDRHLKELALNRFDLRYPERNYVLSEQDDVISSINFLVGKELGSVDLSNTNLDGEHTKHQLFDATVNNYRMNRDGRKLEKLNLTGTNVTKTDLDNYIAKQDVVDKSNYLAQHKVGPAVEAIRQVTTFKVEPLAKAQQVAEAWRENATPTTTQSSRPPKFSERAANTNPLSKAGGVVARATKRLATSIPAEASNRNQTGEPQSVIDDAAKPAKAERPQLTRTAHTQNIQSLKSQTNSQAAGQEQGEPPRKT